MNYCAVGKAFFHPPQLMYLRKRFQGEKGYSDFQDSNTEGILYFLQEYTNTSLSLS